MLIKTVNTLLLALVRAAVAASKSSSYEDAAAAWNKVRDLQREMSTTPRRKAPKLWMLMRWIARFHRNCAVCVVRPAAAASSRGRRQAAVRYGVVCPADGQPGYTVYVVVSSDHPWFKGQDKEMRAGEDLNRYSHAGIEWTFVGFRKAADGKDYFIVGGDTLHLYDRDAMRASGMEHYAYAKAQLKKLVHAALAALA